ncbi:MAG: toxin-antitoxin system HicB family antitoxin [Fimbriimonadaceae bacterium]|nr:MAG: toxin-antitoxin system HicB family antitoxin [Fimbriimonadaceae bacterium]
MADKKSFPLRLPPELHDELQRLAAAELRSVNAQIEILLREGLRKRGIEVKPKGSELSSD